MPRLPISIFSSLVFIFTVVSYGKTRLSATLQLRDGASIRTDITALSPAGDLEVAFENSLIRRTELSLISFDHEPAPFTEEPLVISAQTDVAITATGPLYGFYSEESDGKIAFLGIAWKESREKPGTYEAIRSWLIPGPGLKRIYVAGGAYFEMFSRVPNSPLEDSSLNRIRKIFHSDPTALADSYVHEKEELPYRNLMAFFLASKQYRRAEAVLQEWLSVLSLIQRSDPTGVAAAEFRRLSQITGLSNPELVTLRDQYFAAMNGEAWDMALEIKQLMDSRQQEFRGTVKLQPSLKEELGKAISLRSALWAKVFTGTPKLESGNGFLPGGGVDRPGGFASGILDISQIRDGLVFLNRRIALVDSRYLSMINSAPRGHFAMLTSAVIFLQEADQQFLDRGATAPSAGVTKPVDMPDRVHVGQSPRYGFADFDYAVGLIENQPMSNEVRGGLRLLDLLLKR